MNTKIFNTTDEQSLLLESGDTIRANVVVDSGKLSIKIQKDSDTPIYESDNIAASESFDVEIQESGTYKITVTGEKTKGGVSFEKAAGEKAKREEVQQEASKHLKLPADYGILSIKKDACCNRRPAGAADRRLAQIIC